jgi:hypothetical protein
VGGSLESGILFNPDSPPDGLNFGHLFTDKANQPLFNQLLLTVQRPIDPKATDYDFGFKVQVMYGTDARYTHYLGELDYIINDRSQITPVEAWAIVHTPWLFAGGIDIKAGQYVTLEGAETIDPTTFTSIRIPTSSISASRLCIPASRRSLMIADKVLSPRMSSWGSLGLDKFTEPLDQIANLSNNRRPTSKISRSM